MFPFRIAFEGDMPVFPSIFATDMKLTIKQEKFCNYYLETGNASEAYRRAFSCNKMKPGTVNRKAIELFENGKITARVEELRRELKKKSDITKEEAVGILADIARANISDMLNVKATGDFVSVSVKDISRLPASLQRCILSIKSTDKGGYELKLYNKIDAIDRLSKLLGWDEPARQEVANQNGQSFTIRVVNNKEELPDGDIDD